MASSRPVDRLHWCVLAVAFAVFVWSGLRPTDRFNWFAETFPAMVGGVVLLATYRRFRLTSVCYILIAVFAVILMIGGHYTYANVPIGNFVRDALGLERNHFDRVGHFMQGVVPAMVGREMLLRTSPLRRGKWLFFLAVCVGMSISAWYELFEWQYAEAFGGERAEDFLGSQGDVWDAQKDMFMALLGTIVSQLSLGGLQDRQLAAAGSRDQYI